ncbi:MAG: SIS domain-containing protein [Caldilineaceae bacterium]|nr:SIS domain-containing protein [Caldilineaceae bacterium]
MNQFRSYMSDIQRTIDRLPIQSIETVVERLHGARMKRQQIFVMGNGGSAATASHMACDLGKNTIAPNTPRIRIHALTDNMSFFSAYGNDCGYESVFAEQLANYVEANDVVIAISASGNSANVLNAVKLAREHGAYTIGWSGYDGGKLAHLVDLPIVVPSHNIEQIEDIHMMLSHMVTMALRNAVQKPHLFAVNGSATPLPTLIAN